MKKIKSKISVKYNDTTRTSKTVLMTGEINEVYQNTLNGSIEFVYKYTDIDGVEESKGKFSVSRVEADEMFSLISANLPDVSVVGFSEFNDSIYLEAFKIKMSEHFTELTIKDIEIID